MRLDNLATWLTISALFGTNFAQVSSLAVMEVQCKGLIDRWNSVCRQEDFLLRFLQLLSRTHTFYLIVGT